jgi:HNH endonuclease.
MDLVLRSVAKERGLSRYFTGQPCKRGHIAERWVSGFKCVQCHAEYVANHPEHIRVAKRKWKKANPEVVRAHGRSSRRRWVAKNRTKERERLRKYKVRNRERMRREYRKYYETKREERLAYFRHYRETQPDKRKATCRKWDGANPDKTRAKSAKRWAAKLNAAPAWLTTAQKQEVASIYEQAVLCERLTGVKHHVDHIEPLQGRDRCGLHVPWNLQILSGRENQSKGNRTNLPQCSRTLLPAASSRLSSTGFGRS